MTREDIIANIILCIELEGDGGISSFTAEEKGELIAFMNQLRKDNTVINEELVDLGLPSGTLWAKCNLGAEKETDFGLFYQWGDPKGYHADNADENHEFTWDTYKYGTSWDNITKYNEDDYKFILDNEDDPVYVATNGKMVSPTKEQLHELIDNTYHEWTEIDGVKGMKFINKNDNTKYIFIPATGVCDNFGYYYIDSWGCIWSLSRGYSNPHYAWYMYVGLGCVGVDSYNRCDGYNIRGVVNK